MSIVRQIPNMLSAARIAAAPLLLWLMVADQQRGFALVMAAAFASDILDGAIARRFGLVSELGSLLDSVADILLFLAVALGVWHFATAIHSYLPVFLLVVGAWVGVSLVGFLRYGRLASFHTLLTRVSATFLGLFILALLFVGFVPWLF